MLKLAIVAVCLVAVSCQSYQIDYDTPSDRGCCTPDQWEGVEGLVGGYARFIRKGAVRGFVQVSYDAKNERIASVANMTNNGKSSAVRIIEDYTNKYIYIINLSRNRCRKIKFRKSFKKACVPENAERIGEFYQGVGSSKLNQVSYRVSFRKGFNAVEAVFSVTKKGCIPVGEVLSGRVKGVSFLDSIGFANITPGIKDPAVFKPPRSCDDTDDSNFEVHDYMLYREFRVFGL